MKIKLAILHNDIIYLNRIINVFNTKYAEKIQVYSFTKLNNALEELENSRIDVFIASDVFEINVSEIPKRCGFAYLVDSADIETFKDQHAICRFQKVDLIYRQILSIYSENAGSIASLKIGDDSCKTIAFTAPSGGVGSSTMAAACAFRFAGQGKKTLYLNFEKCGLTDVFFQAEGQFDMSDIIFALKSKKSNLSIKLESCLKQDQNGVFFYSQPKIALDMLEFNAEEMVRLISQVKLSSSYDCIILDLDFGLDNDSLNLFRQADSVIWTGDGSEISNYKIKRALHALSILEKDDEISLLNRISLVYNKFSSKSSRIIDDIEIKNIGGTPRYEHATTKQVLEKISQMQMFDNI